MAKLALFNYVALLLSTTHAFSPFTVPSKTSVDLAIKEDVEKRRSFLSTVAGSLAIGGMSLTRVESAQAFGGGLEKANAKLRGFGLPTIPKIPNGFSPLVEVYGRGGNRDPYLVQFVHPVDWVVTLPSQGLNGEDGTVQLSIDMLSIINLGFFSS